MRIALLLPLEDNDLKILEMYDKTEKIMETQNSFLVSLLLQLMKCGHKLYVFSMSLKKEHIYRGIRLETRTIQIGRHGNLRALFNFKPDIYALFKALKEIDCDIYQVHWCYEYAAAALNVCEEKTIVTMHDWPEAIGVYLNNFFWRRKLSLGKRNVLKGNNFVAVSPYMKGFLDSAGKNTVLIPNYIEKSRIIEKRREYNFVAPRIVHISNGFDERKNTKNCIKMFAFLRNIIPKASLIMIGSSYGQGQEAERWSEENGISEGVIFMGRLSSEQVYCELSKSEVLVSTSREESFGLTLI